MELNWSSLDALGQNCVAAVVDHNVHEAGEGKEKVDGGVPNVGDVLWVLEVLGRILAV